MMCFQFFFFSWPPETTEAPGPQDQAPTCQQRSAEAQGGHSTRRHRSPVGRAKCSVLLASRGREGGLEARQ